MHHPDLRGGRYIAALTFITLMWWGLPAAAQEDIQVTPSDGLDLPDQSISAQDDAASLEVNPAGLGFMENAEFQYNLKLATADFDRTVSDGHAFFAAAGGGGFGIGVGAQFLYRPGLGGEFIDDDYRKYTIAGALGDGDVFSLGFAYNIFGSGTDQRLDELRAWDVGAQIRLNPHVGIGLFARDINSPFLANENALPIRYGVGGVWRLWEGRIQLDQTIGYAQTSGDAPTNEFLDLTSRVVLEFVDGLRLFGRGEFSVSTSRDAQSSNIVGVTAGLELSMKSFGIQGAGVTSFDEGNDAALSGSSYTFWAATNKKRGLVELKDRWILIELSKPLADLPSGGLFGPSSESFIELLVDLDAIANSDDVEGVVFNVAGTSLGYGQTWELVQRIEALNKAGKETVCVLQTADNKAAMIASTVKTTWMMPYIVYEPAGLSADVLTYADLLENVGINAQFLRIKEYKSSPEAYIKEEPTKESLEQTTAFLDQLWDTMVTTIARGRDKTANEVRASIDAIPLLPNEAMEAGYIDGILYRDELKDTLRETYGKRIALEKGWRPAPTSEERWRRRPEVAVVVISGAIIQGSSSSSPFGGSALSGSETLSKTLEALRRNRNVKAVVIRVDSPGGSAIASDQIYRKIRRLAQKKPVITSMGNVAASGGYYVAAGGDSIYATPMTLTGSIGIFAGKISFAALADRVGISVTTLSRGERSGAFSLWTPWDDEQRAYVAKNLVYLYELFLHQISITRPLDPEELHDVARGRVWSGEAARERKLTDHTGGLIDAVREAERLAGLPARSATEEVYPKLATGLLSNSAGNALAPLLKQDPPEEVDTLVRLMRPVKHLLKRAGWALYPVLFEQGEAMMLPSDAILLD